MKATEMETKKKNGKYLIYSNKMNQVVKWWPEGSSVITNI